MRRLQEVVLWLGAALGLIALGIGAAIAFFGFHLLVFRSGSMAPDIPTGAVALARTVPAEDLAKGDVVSVLAEDGRRVTHRIASTTLRDGTASLVLKGDANSTEDAELYRVDAADRVVASLPWGGYVLAHALTPPGLVACGAVAMMLVVVGFMPSPTDQRRGAAASGRGSRHRGRPRGRHRVVAATVAALVVGGAAVGASRGVTGTWAVFTDRATLSSGSFATTPYFTCATAVRGVGSPYLWWRFDETGLLSALAPAADSSTNNRPGSYQNVGGVATGQSRACGRDTGTAVALSTPLLSNPGWVATQGTTAVSGNATFGTFSASLWFKTTTSTGGKLFGFGNSRDGVSGNYDRHVYMTNDGRLVFGVYPGTVRTVTTPGTYRDGAWHQVVATLSSAGMRLYVDGTLAASRTDTTTAQDYSGYWRVGYDNIDNWVDIPSSRGFTGTVDDFAVYTTALTDASVAAGFRAGRPSP